MKPAFAILAALLLVACADDDADSREMLCVERCEYIGDGRSPHWCPGTCAGERCWMECVLGVCWDVCEEDAE
jgi:hypothetical protein